MIFYFCFIHLSSISKDSHFSVWGTTFNTHFDFSPYKGSTQPFSPSLLRNVFFNNRLTLFISFKLFVHASSLSWLEIHIWIAPVWQRHYTNKRMVLPWACCGSTQQFKLRCRLQPWWSWVELPSAYECGCVFLKIKIKGQVKSALEMGIFFAIAVAPCLPLAPSLLRYPAGAACWVFLEGNRGYSHRGYRGYRGYRGWPFRVLGLILTAVLYWLSL